MKKMSMSSPYITDQNIAKIGELFPNVLTEMHDENGVLKQAINFELLKQELSDVIVEGDKERYQLTWPGKKEAILNANLPIHETLRPVREDSVNWDNTKNVYIEGDNLEVMKLLQESYLNKVKCIYIDPPYNTGNDFIYNDHFVEEAEEYLLNSGQIDDRKQRLFQNKNYSGRFHSDWLTMIYPRLKVSRTLLSQDGVIFISIDDGEVHNFKKICDEIFGEQNFITTLVWEKKKKGSFLSKTITNIKEYILVYCKNHMYFDGLIGEINDEIETYPCINASNKREIINIPEGIQSNYREQDFFLEKGTVISDTTMNIVLHSDLVIKNGVLIKDLKVEGNWRYSQELMYQFAKNKELYLTQDLYLRRIVKEPRHKALKDILFRVGREEPKVNSKNINTKNLFSDGWGSNEDADEEQRLLFGVQGLASYPKPTRLLMKLILSVRDEQALILDFFSGSSTTAEAVMALNALDGGKRTFIMVQLPEDLDVTRLSADGSVKNLIDNTIRFLDSINKPHLISEIGKERIRRAANKIKQETDADIDYGFRVYKIDCSNMKDIYYKPDQLGQLDLLDLQSNIKEDRTAEDLLIQVMLELGLELSVPMNARNVEGFAVYDVDYNKLTACFEENITESVIKQIATTKPEYAVFRDHGFQDDSARINVHELFKLLSPNTDVRVL
jgi:adenine-specific DNA-methyltransferase